MKHVLIDIAVIVGRRVNMKLTDKQVNELADALVLDISLVSILIGIGMLISYLTSGL